VTRRSPGAAAVEARRPRVVVATMLVATSIVMAATAGIIAIVPLVGRDLATTQSEIQLAVDATAVALGALLLPAGALLDRWGRRRGLLVGLCGVVLAMIWCVLADSPVQLIAARVATGCSTALVFPATLSTMIAVAAPAHRSRLIGLWAGAAMVGGVYGLLVGGLCGELGEWRLLFVSIGVLAVVALVGTLRDVPETREPGRSHVDPLGSLLAFVGIGAIVLAIIELPVRSIGDPLVLVAGVLGVLGITAFIGWELRAPRPLLDVRMFADPALTGATLAVVLLFAGSYGWFFLSFQYGAYVLGWGPLLAALLLLPNAASTVPMSIVGPGLAQRFGSQRVIAVALLATAVGFTLMAVLGGTRSFVWLGVAFFAYGFGSGLAQGPATEAIVDALPSARQGVASALNDTAREVGAAVGIASIGALFNAGYRASIDGSATAGALHDVARASPAVGYEAAERAGTGGTLVREAVATATVDGWTLAFAVAPVAFLAAAILIWRLQPRAPRAPVTASSART